jgi:ribonuclease HI
MILTSEVKFPKKIKKYRLKKGTKEIFIKLMENFNKSFNAAPPVPADTRKKYDFIIYTDGGFDQIHNIGSWSYLIKVKHGKTHFKYHRGSGVVVSKRRSPILTEIGAVLHAITYIENKASEAACDFIIDSITVYSDSKQVVFSNQMFLKYQNNNWCFLRSNVVMYDKLKAAWDSLHNLNQKYNITYKWVQGHSGNINNERCDKVCTTRIRQTISEMRIMRHNMT